MPYYTEAIGSISAATLGSGLRSRGLLFRAAAGNIIEPR